jgi:hypothetical protein
LLAVPDVIPGHGVEDPAPAVHARRLGGAERDGEENHEQQDVLDHGAERGAAHAAGEDEHDDSEPGDHHVPGAGDALAEEGLQDQ